MIKIKKVIIDATKEYVSIKYFDENKNKNFKFMFLTFKTLEDLLKTEFLKDLEEILKNPGHKKSEAD